MTRRQLAKMAADTVADRVMGVIRDDIDRHQQKPGRYALFHGNMVELLTQDKPAFWRARRAWHAARKRRMKALAAACGGPVCD